MVELVPDRSSAPGPLAMFPLPPRPEPPDACACDAVQHRSSPFPSLVLIGKQQRGAGFFGASLLLCCSTPAVSNHRPVSLPLAVISPCWAEEATQQRAACRNTSRLQLLINL